MRNQFILSLCELAKINKNIILIVGDLGYSVVEPFSTEFPDRFINAGVAEQNMMGMAAGMASEGYHVFVYSIANFPTFRCAEQIRNDIDYHNLHVTIVSVGAGLSYGNLGYSHHAIQDLALMRSMPNTLIATPIDPLEVKSCLECLVRNPGPSYLRLGKAGEKNHRDVQPLLDIGKICEIVPSKNNKIILVIGRTIEIGKKLLDEKEFFEFGLFSIPLWSSKSKGEFMTSINQFKEVIFIEDHLEDGGFCSWAREALGQCPIAIKFFSFSLSSNVIGKVGNEQDLFDISGMTVENIILEYRKKSAQN